MENGESVNEYVVAWQTVLNCNTEPLEFIPEEAEKFERAYFEHYMSNKYSRMNLFNLTHV